MPLWRCLPRLTPASIGRRSFPCAATKVVAFFDKARLPPQEKTGHSQMGQVSLVQLLAGEAVEPLARARKGKGAPPQSHTAKRETEPRGWRTAQVRSSALGSPRAWARQLETDHREQAAERRAVARLQEEEQRAQTLSAHGSATKSIFQRSVDKFLQAEGAREHSSLKSRFVQKSSELDDAASDEHAASDEAEVHAQQQHEESEEDLDTAQDTEQDEDEDHLHHAESSEADPDEPTAPVDDEHAAEEETDAQHEETGAGHDHFLEAVDHFHEAADHLHQAHHEPVHEYQAFYPDEEASQSIDEDQTEQVKPVHEEQDTEEPEPETEKPAQEEEETEATEPDTEEPEVLDEEESAEAEAGEEETETAKAQAEPEEPEEPEEEGSGDDAAEAEEDVFSEEETHVHDTAHHTTDPLEEAHHVAADEYEHHHEHEHPEDPAADDEHAAEDEMHVVGEDAERPHIEIPVNGGELEVPLDEVAFDHQDDSVPAHAATWEEREAEFEAAEAKHRTRHADVEAFQETFPKVHADAHVHDESHDDEWQDTHPVVEHKDAEMEEEGPAAEHKEAEMEVEEERADAADAAQEEEQSEEKALDEAESSFPAPGDREEAVDEATEHKALEDAEESFPAPTPSVEKEDDEETAALPHVAAKTPPKDQAKHKPKDKANVVYLSLKVPLDAESWTPQVRASFTDAIAKAAGVEPDKVTMPSFADIADKGEEAQDDHLKDQTPADKAAHDATQHDATEHDATEHDATVQGEDEQHDEEHDSASKDAEDEQHQASSDDATHEHHAAASDDDVLDKRHDLHVEVDEEAVHSAAKHLQQHIIEQFENSSSIGADQLADHEDHDSGRRLLAETDKSSQVDLEIEAKNPAAAAKMAARLTADKINTQLKAAGLPSAEIVKAAHVGGAHAGGAHVGGAHVGGAAEVATHTPASSPPKQPAAHPASPGASVWPHHTAQAKHTARDPTKLEREGVNVDGAGGVYRALALPVFDDTQWDHVLGGPKAASDAEERHARDTGLHVLKKAGVLVDAVPIEEESNQDRGWLPKAGKPNKSFVHTLFGMQTRLPYFADAHDPVEEDKSRQALVRAGVRVGPLTWDGQDHPISGSSDGEGR